MVGRVLLGDSMRADRKYHKARYHAWVRAGIVNPPDYETWLLLLEVGNGGCWVCGRQPTTRSLNLHHDHTTGKWLGLLCQGCNALEAIDSTFARRVAIALPSKLLEYATYHYPQVLEDIEL